nr:MAG TPA: GET complex subunit GET2 [Caudoviricetes sp.]
MREKRKQKMKASIKRLYVRHPKGLKEGRE